MPRLIHLNGPSRVGKSTIARRYASEHPGTLDLDLDVLVGLIGGWEADPAASMGVARDLGGAMARRHAASGGDIILPQLVTIHDAEPWGEVLAAHAAADYVEVALLVGRGAHATRLSGKRAEHAVDARVQEDLMRGDGELVERIRGHLDAYLARRPGTRTIDTTHLDEEATYRRLLDLLAEPTPAAQAPSR